ncbi:MAG: YetF domain-containing protein, partial [Pseudomonadota bacterium]|nr:YetF domain-containing protein [Pseudomonadota bacterium]
MDPILLDQQSDLVRAIVSAPVMYITIVLLIRISGKRSTSQMNNFDWIVTVAIGSLAASGIVLKGVTVLESIGGIATLLLLQWILTKSVLHSRFVSKLVKAEPVVLVEKGEFREAAMRKERVTKREVMSALREHGLVDPDEAQWVILETDASLSVIKRFEGAVPRAR